MRNKIVNKQRFFIVLFVLSLIGCEKYGEIIEDAQFIGIDYFGTCFTGDIRDSITGVVIGDTNVLIRDSMSYKEYFEKKRLNLSNGDCDTAELTTIDFNKVTLLGTYTKGGGCRSNTKRKVYDDIENKKIVYVIEENYSGVCEKLIYSYNWVLIPKIKDDYAVEFIVE